MGQRPLRQQLQHQELARHRAGPYRHTHTNTHTYNWYWQCMETEGLKKHTKQPDDVRVPHSTQHLLLALELRHGHLVAHSFLLQMHILID